MSTVAPAPARRGRIPDAERPEIPLELPEPVETDVARQSRRWTADDIHPGARRAVDQALNSRKRILQPLPGDNLDVAEEFARQCRAYGRIHNPELTVNAQTLKAPLGVAVTARVRQHREKSEATPSEPETPRTGPELPKRKSRGKEPPF